MYQFSLIIKFNCYYIGSSIDFLRDPKHYKDTKKYNLDFLKDNNLKSGDKQAVISKLNYTILSNTNDDYQKGLISFILVLTYFNDYFKYKINIKIYQHFIIRDQQKYSFYRYLLFHDFIKWKKKIWFFLLNLNLFQFQKLIEFIQGFYAIGSSIFIISPYSFLILHAKFIMQFILIQFSFTWFSNI